MKKISFKATVAFLMALILVLSISTVAFASYTTSPSVNFTTSGNTGRFTIDSQYLACECIVSNSNSPHVTVTVYVDGKAVRTENILGSGKIDWIDMGASGNHTVQVSFKSASSGQSATVSSTLYSWN